MDYVQPQAPEIEEAIIGACLIEKTAMPLIAERLRPEMFYTVSHQVIYTALLAMHRAGQEIDMLTVTEELQRRNKLKEAGGHFEIAKLSSKVASSAHIERHALILHEKYMRREMILGFNKLLALSTDNSFDIGDTMIDAQGLLDRLAGELTHDCRLRDMDQLMEDTLTEAATRIEKGRDGVTGIPTGLTDLDRMTAGWQNGDLIIGAARPGVGKTAVALHMARAAAKAGHAVVVYSLEMQGERLGDRLLMAASPTLSFNNWKSGQVSAEELAGARQVAAELARLPIRVDDSTDVSMDKIRNNARLLHSKGKCDLIIIDYLQLCDMRTDQSNRNREQEVAQASRKAKLLAKELNVPIVLLSQLNRESETRPKRLPELGQLRESGAIEQDADIVFLLYRPAMAHLETDRESGYPAEGLGVMIVAKHRNGETGNVYFSHNRTMMKIADYTPPMEWLLAHSK